MWISKKKYQQLEKKIADLEVQVQGQQAAFNYFLDSEKQSKDELTEILKDLEINITRGISDAFNTNVVQ